MIQRRELITLLGSAAAAWPVVARAQQDGRVRRVGVLMPYDQSDLEGQARVRTFRQGLTDLGWSEGRNTRFEVIWASADVEQQRKHAGELVGLAPEVILTYGTSATQAMRNATRTIPIVFVGLSDPVATGVVSNMARPEANVTGFMAFETSMVGKWLSLLKDLIPRLARVAVVFNPNTAPYAPSYLRAAQEAGERLSLEIIAASVRDVAAIEPAVAAMAGSQVGGLVVLPDVFFVANSATMIALTAKYRVPAIYVGRPYPVAGSLISYGTDQRRQFRDGATYVDRILRGAKPGDLPVQFATKFELVINLKTAKALSLYVSQQLQFLADEVIE